MRIRISPRLLLFTLVTAALALLISSLRASLSTTAIITLLVPDEPASAGELVEVDFWISGADDVGAFEIKLAYDRSLVEIVSVVDGDFLGPTEGCDPGAERCASYLSVLNEDGLTSVGAFTYGSGPGSSGDGLLATLQLMPTGTPGDVTLHFQEVILLDVEAGDLVVSSQDATLTIKGEERIYLPMVSR